MTTLLKRAYLWLFPAPQIESPILDAEVVNAVADNETSGVLVALSIKGEMVLLRFPHGEAVTLASSLHYATSFGAYFRALGGEFSHN